MILSLLFRLFVFYVLLIVAQMKKHGDKTWQSRDFEWLNLSFLNFFQPSPNDIATFLVGNKLLIVVLKLIAPLCALNFEFNYCVILPRFSLSWTHLIRFKLPILKLYDIKNVFDFKGQQIETISTHNFCYSIYWLCLLRIQPQKCVLGNAKINWGRTR